MNSEIDKNILSNNNIKSKRGTPIIPLILFATAIASFVIALSMKDENGAKMPTLIIALTLAVIGIVKFFISDILYIYTPTGEIIKKHELFFEQKEREYHQPFDKERNCRHYGKSKRQRELANKGKHIHYRQPQHNNMPGLSVCTLQL